ncbi:MAG: (d)CMP kinase [Clostridia bacterium]|nr:(d)CMP kinase [Clostridia bacterium]
MINIAIDGPSGAGKSTVSRAVAKMLGYIYIDTGAMYRTLAYKALKLGIDISSETDRVDAMLSDTVLDIRHAEDGQHMFADGEDVTAFIRTPAVSMGASAISAIPAVRSWLLEMQRSFARENNCIMDGRDIGTVVLPDAGVKIFLTASSEARAKRRFDELKEKGEDVTFEAVLSDMIKRDEDDTNRACAPLAAAEDAVIVDSGDITFEQTVDKIIEIINNKVGR